MNGHGEAGNGEPRLPRSEKSAGMDIGMRVLSYLIAGVALYGFLGWLGDHFLGTGFLLPLGIVLGAGLACYVIIRRFGSVDEDGFDAAEPTPRQSGRVRGGAR